MKLEHIAITISDDKELNNFYHDVLDFESRKNFELSKELSEKIFGISVITPVYLMQNDNLNLEIFISSDLSSQKYNHVCLSVKNRDEIYKKALARGYDCICIERDISDLVFIKDKSGNLFEIKEG